MTTFLGISAYPETWVTITCFGAVAVFMLVLVILEEWSKPRKREKPLSRPEVTRCGIIGADDAFPAYMDDDSADADDGGF